jgi:hypothetical protein
MAPLLVGILLAYVLGSRCSAPLHLLPWWMPIRSLAPSPVSFSPLLDDQQNQGTISELPSMAIPSPWQAWASPKPRRSMLWPWTPCSLSLYPTTPIPSTGAGTSLHLPGAGNPQVQAPRTPMAASLSIAAELPYFLAIDEPPVCIELPSVAVASNSFRQAFILSRWMPLRFPGHRRTSVDPIYAVQQHRSIAAASTSPLCRALGVLNVMPKQQQ